MLSTGDGWRWRVFNQLEAGRIRSRKGQLKLCFERTVSSFAASLVIDQSSDDILVHGAPERPLIFFSHRDSGVFQSPLRGMPMSRIRAR